MFVTILTHLIAYSLGGLTMFYVGREYWSHLAEWELRLSQQQTDTNLDTLRKVPTDTVSFVQPDATKRKPGRPRNVRPTQEPVVLTRQPGRRTH